MRRLVLLVLIVSTSMCVTARYHHLAYVGIRHDEPEAENTTEVQVASGRQAPYSYYYIGRKLWYIPLYFSLYFVIYVAALIIRAIARHKVTFPERLPSPGRSLQSRLDRATSAVTSSIDNAAAKYM